MSDAMLNDYRTMYEYICYIINSVKYTVIEFVGKTACFCIPNIKKSYPSTLSYIKYFENKIV